MINMNIFLIGYRCTGKTTIAKRLTEKTKMTFVDADVMLVENAGMTVAEIVDKHGWNDFRDRESAVLEELCTQDNNVIATGGGVILRETNVSIMKKAGTVVWLTASVETIAKRMAADANTEDQRPGLTDKGSFDEIEETLYFRNPLYKNAMTFAVDSDSADIEKVCKEILDKIKE